MRLRVAGVVLTLLPVVAGLARAGDWPRFRGPNGSGVSDSRALPVEFGPKKNLDWAADVSFGRSGRPIGPNDLLIAAIARAHDLVLVTHNTREFGRVTGLRVVDWET